MNNKLTIVGTNYDAELIDHVKSALSDTLSPVSKNAIVRSLLTRMLNADNESTLDQHFVSEMPSTAEKSVTKGAVITLNRFNDGVLESQTPAVCTNPDSITRTYQRFFSSAFPDNDGIACSVTESSFIQEWLDRMFEADFDADDELVERLQKERGELENELYIMTAYEIEEFLLDNLDISALVSEDFMEFLTMGMYKIETDHVDFDQ